MVGIACALLLVASGVSWDLIQGWNEEPRKRYGDSGERGCSSLTGTSNMKELSRVVPNARHFRQKTTKVPNRDYPFAGCQVLVGGTYAVTFMVKVGHDFEGWKEAITTFDMSWPNGRHRLDAYRGGYSGPRSVAIYVPCPRDNDLPQSRNGLSVTVFTPPENGNHEKDLIVLAKRTAKWAISWVGCGKTG